MKILTRPYAPGSDDNFILNSWLMSSRKWHEAMGGAYFKLMEPAVKQLLVDREVLVAYNSDLPEQLFGYIIFDSRFRLIDFCYVKKHFRNQGIGKKLLDATGIDPQYCTTCPGAIGPHFTYIGVP